MLGCPVTRRWPLWPLLVVAWLLPTSTLWQGVESWRPELLLLLVAFVALRLDVWHAAGLGLLAGWALLLWTPAEPWWLLAGWVLIGGVCAWLKVQWHTESVAFFVLWGWLLVMGWHSVTWLARAMAGAAPPAWSISWVATQTAVTAVCGWAIATRLERYCVVPTMRVTTSAVTLLASPQAVIGEAVAPDDVMDEAG